ncbi:EAL domain-containing protein [Sporosarcina limicola]|uniref:Diguanylate cyclase (GGDEF)-like protein/PAS domain S-box-containing protein n=1 Tax=Sporosarcina limicola TaxID=34101 RepID=A0A927MMQ1_9BACL|nr:diguanylate cyclase (GGDEF)-like protein/PAS domain S-box-containing protein [Sporosarcina limicola]
MNERIQDGVNEIDYSIEQELADVKYALDKSSIVAITDRRGTIVNVNKQFCKISGYSEEELLGENHRILNSGFHPSEFFKEMWKTIGSGNIWRDEIKNRAKDGSFYWVDTTIVPSLNEKGKAHQYVSIRNDITNRIEAEQRLRDSEEQFRLITENTSDLIGVVDVNGDFIYFSPSCETVLGYNLELMKNSTITDWIHEDERISVVDEMRKIMEKEMFSSQIEFRFRTSRGEYMECETKINPVFDNAELVRQFVFVARDITERKKSERVIHHLAYHDPLTDLPNRRLFFDRLFKEVENAKQTKESFTVMVLDLDRFKYINDSWGHEMGDVILIETARLLRKSLSEYDLVSRLGGDEFTILLPKISNILDVKQIAEKILEYFKIPIDIWGNSYTMSCSIGIAIYPENGKEADVLFSRADAALYSVKKSGRGGYALFTREMEMQSLERILMENELRKAIELEQFHIHYQPKISFFREEINGMEALVRWQHPELGLISPERFIPLAEDNGFIIQLGEWVMRRSCAQNKKWQQQGLPFLRVSVNVSVKQLMEPDFVTKVETILMETGLESCWLEIEVTESTFVDVDDATSILEEIRSLGIRISIDDFGTGYSSFSYLKQLPVDTLKIDRSFIEDIDTNEESKAIVKAVLTIAETLGMDVIAEGVETREQLAVLHEDGCSQAQGFLFSKPLTEDEFEVYLRNSQRYISKNDVKSEGFN